MHNNIMAAGSRDRPPMLATGRYAQWRSRFLRYIDTRPNGDALRKCILTGPYTPTMVTTPAVPATEDSPEVPAKTSVETVLNMTPENKAHYESEKEAIHLILTGIGDEIYSTVDACQTAQEMWEAIERLQQGESLNIQDVKTNLFWEFGQFTSHDGETIESYYTRFYKMMNEMIRNNLTVATMQVNVQFLQQLQPEWSRFVTIVKQQHKLDEVSYHKLFDILKQYQKEKEKEMQKNLALIAKYLRNSTNLPTTTSELLKTPETRIVVYYIQDTRLTIRLGQFGIQRAVKCCRKAQKGLKDSTYHKEMCCCRETAEGKVFNFQAEHSDWLAERRRKIVDTRVGSTLQVTWQRFRRSHYEGLVKEKTKSINQTIHMLAPKCPIFNGRPTFANPMYLKKAQYEHPGLYAITQDQSDPATRLIPDREEILTLAEESRSKLNKDFTLLRGKYFRKEKSVPKTNESEGLSKPVTLQNLPKTAMQAVRNTNVIKPGMYRIASSITQTRAPQLNQTFRNTNPRASTSTGSYYRMYIRKRSKAWKMVDRHKQCPSTSNGFLKLRREMGPKTQKKWVPKVRNGRLYNSSYFNSLLMDAPKHMTGNVSLLCNFVEKYLGTVRFGNDQFAPILGYGDLVQGNITIKRVYYVEGLNHNLFSVGQFCDADLEVAFRKSTKLTSSNSNLFLANASPNSKQGYDIEGTFSLNFDYINLLSKKDVVIGLPKLKYVKDQLCSPLVKLSNGKNEAHSSSKTVPSSEDETPEVLKDFLTMIQQNLQATVISVRTDKGTEYLNKTLNAFFKEEGIEHSKLLTPRTPEPKIGIVQDETALSFDEIKEMSETSIANDTSGLVPQRQKASDYDTMPRTTHTLQRIFNLHQNHQLLQMLMLRKTTLIKQNLPILSVHRYKKLLSLPHAIVVISHVIPSINLKILNTDGQKDFPINSSSWKSSKASAKQDGKLATDPENVYVRITVSFGLKPKNIKEAMADSAWIEAMQDELHQFEQTSLVMGTR
ncbi:hypothetical protein Tco_0568068 [Tanacetum coccineum]